MDIVCMGRYTGVVTAFIWKPFQAKRLTDDVHRIVAQPLVSFDLLSCDSPDGKSHRLGCVGMTT